MCLLLLLSAMIQIKEGNVVALVGQYSQLFSSLSDHLRIPYFITSPVTLENPPSPYHIRMIPDVDMYTLAIRDLFQHYEWKSAGVIYNTQFGRCHYIFPSHCWSSIPLFSAYMSISIFKTNSLMSPKNDTLKHSTTVWDNIGRMYTLPSYQMYDDNQIFLGQS